MCQSKETKDKNPFIMRASHVAEFYNKSSSALHQWQKLSGYPKHAHTQYGYINLKILNDWVVNHFYGNTEIAMTMAEAKLRREIAKARREELITQELEGKLISREQVTEDLVVVFSAIKQRLLSWVKGIPPKLKGKEEKDMMLILKDEIWDLLNELSKGLDNIKRLNELEEQELRQSLNYKT
jgi:hypothetical protein